MSDPVAVFLTGLVFLTAGAELLSRGLAWVERAFGDDQPVERFVVATVVYSAPVLAVSLATALSGYPKTALATVIGGNVANVLFVLGLAAVTRPFMASVRLLPGAIMVLIAISALAWFLARDNVLSREDGLWLLAAGVGVTAILARFPWSPQPALPPPPPRAEGGVGWLGGVLLLAGIAGVLAGAAVTVRALRGSVSESGLGGVAFALTSLAGGASLRGVVAAVTAARKGDGNAVLGGVIGACLLNLVLGLGLAAVARPIPVPESLVMNELPVLAGSTLFLIPTLLNGLRVRRWDGVVMLAAYIAFVAWVVARAV